MPLMSCFRHADADAFATPPFSPFRERALIMRHAAALRAIFFDAAAFYAFAGLLLRHFFRRACFR